MGVVLISSWSFSQVDLILHQLLSQIHKKKERRWAKQKIRRIEKKSKWEIIRRFENWNFYFKKLLLLLHKEKWINNNNSSRFSARKKIFLSFIGTHLLHILVPQFPHVLHWNTSFARSSSTIPPCASTLAQRWHELWWRRQVGVWSCGPKKCQWFYCSNWANQ